MSAPDSQHEPFQLAEVLGDRLRRTRKSAVRLQVDRRHLAAEPLEQRRHDDRAGAAHAVERDLELARANPLDVEVRDRQDTFDVSRDAPGRPSSTVPSLSHVARGIPLLDQRAHLGAFGASRNRPVGPMNLSAFHSIGLWLAEIIRPPAA